MPDPKPVSLTALPQVRAMMTLDLSQTELVQFTLDGASGFFGPPPSKEGACCAHGCCATTCASWGSSPPPSGRG